MSMIFETKNSPSICIFSYFIKLLINSLGLEKKYPPHEKKFEIICKLVLRMKFCFEILVPFLKKF